MHKLVIVPALAGALFSTDPAHAKDKSPPAKGSTIAVYGDAPYGTTASDTAQFDETPHFIAAVNADPAVDLVLQVGDIHSGKQYCTEAYDRSIFQLWTAFAKPLIYVPGDNEWSDCHKAAEGGGTYNTTTQQIDHVLDAAGNPVDYAKGDPIANLALIRSIFFARPGRALGGGNRLVASQAQLHDRAHPSDAKYVENVMFLQENVLFVTINLPGGSNNDDDVWYGAPVKSPAQVKEIEERTGAELRWLDAAFIVARALDTRAVVIQAQADMWDAEKGAAHQVGYEPFVKSVAAHTVALRRPVLMLNGDSHVFVSDNPFDPANPINFIHPGYAVPNFHRIVVHGSTFPMEYLRLAITRKGDAPAGPDAFGPFSWERVMP